MNTRDLLHITIYEIKTQSRTWVFRLFVLFSLVFVVACHVFWQGLESGEHWKMMALPCSLPLVNAYLFCVVQSLFLLVIMANLPFKLVSRGAMDSIHCRPVDNQSLFWGAIAGNCTLFLCQNLIVILATIGLVNLTSLAEFAPKYYFFYLFTLNIPCWFIVTGLSVWVSSVFKSRILSVGVSFAWWLGSIFGLPHHYHGLFDYLGSGIPNLFSDLIGHVNLSLYLLQRSACLLTGVGLLFLGTRGMCRIPNRRRLKRKALAAGALLLLGGVGCGYAVEHDYIRCREMRKLWRANVARYGQGETCRVKNHSITLKQEKNSLRLQSDMIVCNPNKNELKQLVFFLNPALKVTNVSTVEGALPFSRDEQALIVQQGVPVGDSLILHIEYAGMIDDRFCDLHLPDTDFEDSFLGDSFFPTGRHGAFVRENLLLLTPASVWYPVVFAPVNPVSPLETGHNFTLFRLHVKDTSQRVLFSQGGHSRVGNDEVFTCEKPLNGISIYGGALKCVSFAAGDDYNLQFGLTAWSEKIAHRFTGLSRAGIIEYWKQMLWMERYNFETIPDRNWYSKESPNLYLLETPVSFHLSGHAGKNEAGMVEPGIVFFRERGFDMDMVKAMKIRKIKNTEELFRYCLVLNNGLFRWGGESRNSHPLLGIRKTCLQGNGSGGESLWNTPENWVYSPANPLAGKMFEYFQDKMKALPMMLGRSGDIGFSQIKNLCDYLLGRTLKEDLVNPEIAHQYKEQLFNLKMQDLWIRLRLNIPGGELNAALDSLSLRKGEMSYETIMRAWDKRWGTNLEEIIKEWESTTHEQFYRVRNMMCYHDKKTGRLMAEGMVLNAGKCGGVVTIADSRLLGGSTEYFNCYVAPGAMKKFRIMIQGDWIDENYKWHDGGKLTPLYLGISANRPLEFSFQYQKHDLSNLLWEPGCVWEDITSEEFWSTKPQNEILVDDSDPGFELVDGNLTLIQRWLQEKPCVKELFAGRVSRWTPYIESYACGDSIRGFWGIGAGSGKSTATWHVTLPEAGRYRVMGKVYKKAYGIEQRLLEGIVYYYTVSSGNMEVKVEVNLDTALPGLFDYSGWISLGEFEFPAGEASVTLSDKEEGGNKNIAIIADAVKWIKIE